MAKELLLEIGTEEIPARFIPPALADLNDLAKKSFETNLIGYKEIKTYGTPRRLVLHVSDVSETQKERVEEIIGPPKKIAYDVSGKPTKAAIGFAKAQGVDVKDLKIKKGEKGEFVSVVKSYKGGASAKILPDILQQVILSIPFPKTMRWGDSDIRFARPIHWIVALFGRSIVPFSIGDIASGNFSFGHRFMAPKSFKVKNFADYIDKCKKAYVTVDPKERKKIILTKINELAKKAGGNVLENSGLIEEVTFLTEYPVPIMGNIEKRFMEIPKEVLINSMREHQRYFSVVNSKGNLLPYFITISNTDTKDNSVVVRGNERVLRARLSDAKFFWEDDQKTKLEKRVEGLKKVVYHSDLGTSYEKMERFKKIAEFLADSLNKSEKTAASRAALLCKTDLITGMVGEFPKLQGVMGREYAKVDGEKPEVALAIYEHYHPAFAGDVIPKSDAGAFISIADKLDTICGIIGVGLNPTGSADPYALRRNALGIINIILGKKYHISLNALVDLSLTLLSVKLKKDKGVVKNEAIEFFKGRVANLLETEGNAYDVVEACITSEFDDLANLAERVKAVSLLKGTPDYGPLGITFKRISNILKDVKSFKTVNKALLQEKDEKALYEGYAAKKDDVLSLIAKLNYKKAMNELSKLRKLVDSFFEGVMVMDKDMKLRENRLALLNEISLLFKKIADFSKIVSG